MWCVVESGVGGGGAAPCGRGKHAAAALGGHVYVLGGRGAGGCVPLRDFWRYSLASGRWERLELRGAPPPSLQEPAATAHRHKLYVFGGEAAVSNETPLWIYDTLSQMWSKVSGQSTDRTGLRWRGRQGKAGGDGAPRGRRGHSAHGLNDCLLIYGGYMDLRGSTNELWAFHYESESWHQVRTSNPGPARHRHAAALHDNRLYVHAGQKDLRDCADLWHYDIMSRVWTQVRVPAKLSPSARAGHAGLKAGAHFYIFGGEVGGHPTNELWRFHFATETWERMVQGMTCPAPRVDARALLVTLAPPCVAPRAAAAPPTRPVPPTGLLREITKLSSFHIRRAARCSYSVLGERDSTESLSRPATAAAAVADEPLAKSRSAHMIDERQPADGDEAPPTPTPCEPAPPTHLNRNPISVPDFSDIVLPTPVLSPVEATKLVYLDSEEEDDLKIVRKPETDAATSVVRPSILSEASAPTSIVRPSILPKNGPIPKSASVRFTETSVTMTTDDDETELSTSDYASAEGVNRLAGFCNPHYLGPDVRKLGAALTPDSGFGAGDIELQEMGERRVRSAPREGRPGGGGRAGGALHVLLVGGREPSHPAHINSPISMWTYRLL